ncbi:pectin lyase fold/virulence factor [Thelonectria olida]|uniref:Pectin lyase fold/virulence factor n=1 Tax=Thelonectria olida TaxID=1576542 RepID=A0A9P8VY23_9HYPO|nr:pectin lyase fold/virulence factor [Thelonectria olida]
MKIASVLVAFFGLAAATPLSSPNDPAARGSCKFKDSRCCLPDEDHPYPDGYPKFDAKKHRTITVKAGKSIQKAINSAACGDRILVEAGTYAEQLTVNTDGIQLIGNGAILVPPKTAVKNTCSGLAGPGSEAGICVTGSGVKLAKFITEHRKVISVEKTVKDVVVAGFKVQKFSGLNIAVVGAKNTRIVKNKVSDGGSYGALTVGSYNTIVAHNQVTSTQLGFIGICMDNFSDVLVSNNKITNQVIALCVQTTSAKVQYNKVSNSCYGAFVDPGVKGPKVIHNYIGPSNPNCGKIGVTGILLDGSINTEVRDNVIEEQKNGGFGAGVAVIDDECKAENDSLSCRLLGHKAIAKDNAILRNTFRKNDYDIFVNTTGTGNVVSCNECTLPSKYCKK